MLIIIMIILITLTRVHTCIHCSNEPTLSGRRRHFRGRPQVGRTEELALMKAACSRRRGVRYERIFFKRTLDTSILRFMGICSSSTRKLLQRGKQNNQAGSARKGSSKIIYMYIYIYIYIHIHIYHIYIEPARLRNKNAWFGRTVVSHVELGRET